MSGQQPNGDGSAPGRRRRPLAEGLLGGAAETSAPRPPRTRAAAPAAVRRAALVVAAEAAVAVALAFWLLFLTLTSSPDSVGRALAEVAYVGLAAALLAGGALGLWRVSAWARGPVVVLQLLIAVIGYTMAFQADRPLWGVPLLAAAALELYLLATPEARLAFFQR